MDERLIIAEVPKEALQADSLKPLVFKRFKSGDINKSFNLSTFSMVLTTNCLTIVRKALSLQGL